MSRGDQRLTHSTLEGMNIARLNLAHCTQAFAAQVISDLRKVQAALGGRSEVAIWIDVNGPKVRYVLRPCIF